MEVSKSKSESIWLGFLLDECNGILLKVNSSAFFNNHCDGDVDMVTVG